MIISTNPVAKSNLLPKCHGDSIGEIFFGANVFHDVRTVIVDLPEGSVG